MKKSKPSAQKNEEKRLREEIQSACLISDGGEEEDNLYSLLKSEKSKSYQEGYEKGWNEAVKNKNRVISILRKNIKNQING